MPFDGCTRYNALHMGRYWNSVIACVDRFDGIRQGIKEIVIVLEEWQKGVSIAMALVGEPGKENSW